MTSEARNEGSLRRLVGDWLEGVFVYEFRWPTCVLLLLLLPIWGSALLVVLGIFALARVVDHIANKALSDLQH